MTEPFDTAWHIALGRIAMSFCLAKMPSEEGWMNGEGLPISKELTQALDPFLEQAIVRGMPMPRLYPTLEGGVQAEWTFQPEDVSVAFLPSMELEFCDRPERYPLDRLETLEIFTTWVQTQMKEAQ